RPNECGRPRGLGLKRGCARRIQACTMHLLQGRRTPGLLAGVPALNIRLMLKGMTNRKKDPDPMNDKKRVTLSRRRLLTGAVANSALVAAPVIVRAQAPVLKIGVLLPRSG